MDLFFDVDKGMPFTIEVGYFDTIQEIKEKVTKYHGIPVHQQTLKFDEKTLPDDLNIHTSNILDGSSLKLITASSDPQPPQQTITMVKTEETPSPPSSHKSLHECHIVDGSKVEMTIKPPPTPPHPPSLCMLKKMKVYVMSKCGEKIGLEVNPVSNVGELRKELERVRHQGVEFRLPEEGYFFIYKQNVMEEDHSFRWHRVGQGDTIEIFNGCVT